MRNATTRTRPDIHQEVTDEMIAMLEAGTRPWARPWQASGPGFSLPLRHNSIAYRGINILILWASAMSRGFQSPHWLTLKADKRAMFTAAREAQRAADYLLDRMELGTAKASPEEAAA